MKKSIFTFIILVSGISIFAQSGNGVTLKASINHTAIFVVDMKKTAQFYGEVIGLDTIPEPFHDGKHIWMKTGEHSALHIIEGADKPKEYFKNQHTCYTVNDFMAFVERLKKQGISYEDVMGRKNTYTNRVDGVHQLWLRDPDGYWIEINDDRS